VAGNKFLSENTESAQGQEGTISLLTPEINEKRDLYSIKIGDSGLIAGAPSMIGLNKKGGGRMSGWPDYGELWAYQTREKSGLVVHKSCHVPAHFRLITPRVDDDT
jgi:hypothetical protein